MQPIQLKMARAALDLSVDELASRAGLSHMDVARIESGENGDDRGAGQLRATLEQAGIEFIGDDAVRFATRTGGIVPLEELNSENDE